MMKKDRNSRLLFLVRLLLTTACIVCIAVAVYQFTDYRRGDTLYTQIAEYVTPKLTEQNEVIFADNDESEEASAIFDFEPLYAINADTVAFIHICDGQNGYPVVRGVDNSYYLKHLFNKEAGSLGCLFLDYRNMSDFSDSNNIIYGHHMKNGSMLAVIENYKDQAYYDENPVLYLMTPDGNYKVILYSAYVTDESGDSWQLSFKAEGDYSDWVSDMKSKSVIDCTYADSVESDADEPLKTLTLSTCDYSFEQAKFIVHGFLLEDN